jgi:hypothetical protein
MNNFRTLGQVLSMESSGHERTLIDRYFEHIFNERDADPQLAKEMFQAFTWEGYDDLHDLLDEIKSKLDIVDVIGNNLEKATVILTEGVKNDFIFGY